MWGERKGYLKVSVRATNADGGVVAHHLGAHHSESLRVRCGIRDEDPTIEQLGVGLPQIESG